MTFEERQADIDTAIEALDTVSPRNDDHEVWLAALDIFTAHDVTNAARDLVKARAGITIARDSLEALSAEYDSFEGAGEVLMQTASLNMVFPTDNQVSVGGGSQSLEVFGLTSLAITLPDHAVYTAPTSGEPVWASWFAPDGTIVGPIGLTGPTTSTLGATLYNTPGTHENIAYTGRVRVNAGAEGTVFRNCSFITNAPQTIDMLYNNSGSGVPPASNSITFENCYFENNRVPTYPSNPDDRGGGKCIYGGGGVFYRCHIVGGGDNVQITNNRGSTFRECLLEEIRFWWDDHVDNIQILSNPGAGGWVTVEDSVLQSSWNMSNSNVQIRLNEITGPCYFRRNWMHGGAQHFNGSDSGPYPVVSEGNYFAWASAQAPPESGPIAQFVGAPSRWWTRQLRPRKGTGGGNQIHATPAGHGANFPGNGALVSEYPWQDPS